MSGRITKTGAQRILAPEKWRKRVALLVRLYSREEAAMRLGVSERQLRRYCDELGLPDGRMQKVSRRARRISVDFATRGR